MRWQKNENIFWFNIGNESFLLNWIDWSIIKAIDCMIEEMSDFSYWKNIFFPNKKN